jgi:hypothetical protein
MALALPTTVARSVLAAGFTGQDAITATAVGIAGRWSSENSDTEAKKVFTVWAQTAPAKRWTTQKFKAYPLVTASLAGLAAASVGAAKTGLDQGIVNPQTVVDAATGGIANPLQTVSTVADRLTDQSLWLRAGKIVIGSALIVVGVSVIAKPYAGPVAQVAAKAVL